MLKKSLVRLSRDMLLLILATNAGSVLADVASAELKAAAKAVRMENYVDAFRWYAIAASNGNVEAQYQLANLYKLGKGVEKNPALERQWLERAAAGRHAGAEFNLALLIQGEAPERAAALMQASAAAGFAPAQSWLQRIGTDAVGAGENQPDAFERWWIAARKNRPDVLATLFQQVGDVDIVDPQQRTALAIAVQAGSREAVAWLLKQGANPSRRDRFGKSAGFIAIDTGRPALLAALFAAGLSPDVTIPNGDTLLHYAVRRGQSDNLASIVGSGIKINQRNSDGWTALDLAESAGDKKAITILKQRGATHGDSWLSNNESASQSTFAAEWTGDRQLTVQQLATVVSAGNHQLLRKLLASHPRLINQPLNDGMTLLALAIGNGQLAVVDTLLDLGAEPSQSIAGQPTALHWAAQTGQTEIAIRLLQRGAALVAVDGHGSDAIEVALRAGHAGLAQALLARLDSADAATGLPLARYVYTAARADMPEFVNFIGLRVTRLYRDDQGRSALWYAAHHGDPVLIAALQRNGVAGDDADIDGRTPFLVAVERGCLACIRQLMATADINHRDNSGNAALQIAAARGDFDVVTLLLAHNADIHARNVLGDTALISAVKADAVDVVGALVKAGASLSRKNRIGLSAQDLARQKSQAMRNALAPH